MRTIDTLTKYVVKPMIAIVATLTIVGFVVYQGMLILGGNYVGILNLGILAFLIYFVNDFYGFIRGDADAQ